MQKIHINRYIHIDLKEQSIFGSMYKKLVIGIPYYEINWASRIWPKGGGGNPSTFQDTPPCTFKILDFVHISYLLQPNIVEI